MRILLTMFLGLWMAVGPWFRVATAADAPPEHPATANPIITDTCIPIEEHHASLQVLCALAVYTANFSQNWRPVSTKGDLYTFSMPVKFTYGPAKNLETYIIAPFIVNWVNNVDRSVAGPNGERSASYAGLGDITTVAKYLVLEEGEIRPAVTLVGGVTWPSGHASHLNPRFLVAAGGAALAVAGDVSSEADVARLVAEHERVRELLQGEVDRVNAKMPQVQHVRQFGILTKELDHDDGEVTATMKVKRKSIYEKYADTIEALYGKRLKEST